MAWVTLHTCIFFHIELFQGRNDKLIQCNTLPVQRGRAQINTVGNILEACEDGTTRPKGRAQIKYSGLEAYYQSKGRARDARINTVGDILEGYSQCN